jgi:hypothetical protein
VATAFEIGMDVVLRTNASNPALAWRGLERWTEQPPMPAGWHALLVLESGVFTARVRFFFDQRVLDEFLEALRHMDQSLSGSAVLQTPNEDPYIKLTVDGSGRVTVSGELVDYDQDLQRLHFIFGTDQTVLRPFIHDFERAQQTLAIDVAAT